MSTDALRTVMDYMAKNALLQIFWLTYALLSIVWIQNLLYYSMYIASIDKFRLEFLKTYVLLLHALKKFKLHAHC